MQIERSADDICAAFLLERELRESRRAREGLRGEVSGVIRSGVFVGFGGELGDVYEGFLPARRLRGEDFFALNETETALVGKRPGAAVRMGDPVSRAGRPGSKRPRGRVDLEPAKADGDRWRKRARSSANRPPATSPPTGAPGTSSSWSRKWRRGSSCAARRSSRCATAKRRWRDSYAAVEKGEVWLRKLHIPPYEPASRENHEPERPRKLLLHRAEIERLVGKTAQRGLTLIPTRIYFKGARAKVELALAQRQGGARQAAGDRRARHAPRGRARIQGTDAVASRL